MPLRALVLALVALAVTPAVAAAGPRQRSLFMDDNLLLYRGDRVATQTVQELARLGVDTVRISLHWRAVAPRHRALRKPAPLRYDPATFDRYDHLLRAAAAAQVDVLVNVTGGAPLWATGRLRGRPVSLQYKPDPRELGRFVAKLGRRYSGQVRDENQGRRLLPRVRTWSIWNEPNQGALLQPQWERDRYGTWRPASPRIYRRLARWALWGLRRSGHARSTVLLGETAPSGVDDRGPTRAMRPGIFLRELLCLDGGLDRRDEGEGCDFIRRGPLEVSGFAHHPYSIVAPPDQPHVNAQDMTLADRGRLIRVLDAAARHGRLPRDLPLWSTEYGYQTMPPDPLRGVLLEDHADWLVRAERLTWADPRVAAHAQFLMLDDVPRRDAPRHSTRYWGTYQSGLRFADGRRKPAYAAYALPFDGPARVARGAPMWLWGLVRAAPDGEPQEVQLELRAPGAATFVPVGAPILVTDPRGYFAVWPAPRSGTWRYRWRGLHSHAVDVFVE